MIEELKKIFRSNIKSLEILCVIEGTKPCARILVGENSEEEVKKYLEDMELNFSVSDFKVLKEKNTGFYSDKSEKAKKSDQRAGHLIYYISKDGSCKSAKSLEADSRHINLGIALGYPRCCAEFFERSFGSENTDLTLKTFENSKGFEFQFPMNICARHFDVSLLSHFPCSFECPLSLDIAKSSLKIIKKYSPDLAGVFADTLSSAVVYTKNEGVFLLRAPRIEGNGIAYSDVLGTERNKMFFFLSSGKKLKVLDKHSFLINGEKINEAVMAFS